ncbi:MAG: penicillin-binding protein 1C [Candidatus Omnitrophota bacterium]
MTISWNRFRELSSAVWAKAQSSWRMLLWGALGCAALGSLIFLWPMDVEYYTKLPPSGEMLDRSGRLLYAALNENGDWLLPRSLEEIDPRMINAVIAAEDQRFRLHPGVDPIAIFRAAWHNLTKRRIVSGASTLAMQVVKMAHQRRGQSCGKIGQALQALRLQARIGRWEILCAYLNAAPYGGNLTGCEAAARRYFAKSALELTLSEAALLSGLPKSPSRYSPIKYPLRALQRRDAVLRRMKKEGFISDKEYVEAKKQSLNLRNEPFPFIAPHLAMQWKSELDGGRRIQTTLDANIQRMAERSVANAVRRTWGEIDNGAAIVIDSETAQVLARVGSADFFHTPGGGQFDACRAARSPGSALKPFTYALAMEANLLYASEILIDDAWDQGLYNPENFNQQYQGLVSASDALKRSLNVPAVAILQRLGADRLCAFLQDAGLSTLTLPAEQYGLSLTLGNCEAQLEELAGAYLMLANVGEYRPLRLRQDDPSPATRRLLSRGVGLKLYDALEGNFPSEVPRQVIQTVSAAPRVCWKTGTSQGYRDAWTFLFNRQYVVGVWLGNNDARSSNRLIGARSALPLAAKIFRALPAKNSPVWPEAQNDLREVEICAVSGLPASSWCLNRKKTLFPREQYLHRLCDMHYPASGVTADNAAAAIVERWPGAAYGWDLAAIQSPIISSLAPHDSAVVRSEDLRILEPSQRAEYLLTGEPDGDRIRLRTSVDAQTPLHWYLGERYIGDSTPEQPLFLLLEPGEYKLSCMTPNGKIDAVNYKVLALEGGIR